MANSTNSTTPDITLTVGVKKTASTKQMKSDIQGIIANIDKHPPKITIGVNQRTAYTQIRKDIEEIITKSNNNPPKIKVGIELVDKDLNNAIEELKKSVNKNKTSSTETRMTRTTGMTTTSSHSRAKAPDDSWRTKAHDTVQKEIYRIGANINNFSAAKGTENYNKLIESAKEYKLLLKDIDSISKDNFDKRLGDIKRGALDATHGLKQAGLATKSLTERMGSLTQKFTAWLTVSQLISTAYQALRKMYSSVVEIDTAMTELKKVTNETAAEYDRFLDRASVRAKKYGSTLSDVVRSTADFARLGYDIKDAEKISDAAIVYKNVGDGISDINQATESIISTMQAFGVEANQVMSIVDKFNIVGNNFAITSGGIGDAMLNSASAMKAAGNSLEETIALITAANEVIQNPEKVGTSLKTVSMFLRAAKTEAEEAGESTDGMASSVSKLREDILALTGNKVDIQIDKNTFKSTTQILRELSGVWGQLTDVSRANILEMIGGKRNSNVVSALIENFETVDEVLEKTGNSAGSALKENEKVLDSIEGKLSVLKASFEKLATELFNSDTIKTFVGALTIVLDLLTSIVEKAGELPVIIGSITFARAFDNINKGINIGKFNPVGDDTSGYRMGYKGKTFSEHKEIYRARRDAGYGFFSSLKTSRGIPQVLDIDFDDAAKKIDRYNRLLTKSPEGAAVFARNLNKSGNAVGAWLQQLNGAPGVFEDFRTSCTNSAESLVKMEAGAKKVSAGTKILSAGLKAVGWGLVSMAISTVISKISEMHVSYEEAMSTIEASNNRLAEMNSNVAENATTLEKLDSRYHELAQGVDELGRNVSLTETEYTEYKSVISQISNIMPELTTMFNSQGEKIAFARGELAGLNEEYLKYQQQEAHKFLYGDEDDGHKAARNSYNNQKEKTALETLFSVGEFGYKLLSGDATKDDVFAAFSASDGRITNPLVSFALGGAKDAKESYRAKFSNMTYEDLQDGRFDLFVMRVLNDSLERDMLGGKSVSEIYGMNKEEFKEWKTALLSDFDEHKNDRQEELDSGMLKNLPMFIYDSEKYTNEKLTQDDRNTIVSAMSALNDIRPFLDGGGNFSDSQASDYADRLLEGFADKEVKDTIDSIFNQEFKKLSPQEAEKQIKDAINLLVDKTGIKDNRFWVDFLKLDDLGYTTDDKWRVQDGNYSSSKLTGMHNRLFNKGAGNIDDFLHIPLEDLEYVEQFLEQGIKFDSWEAFLDMLEDAKNKAAEITPPEVNIEGMKTASESLSTLSTAFKELNEVGYITTETLDKVKTATKLDGAEWDRYQAKLLNAEAGSAEFNQIMSELTYTILENAHGKEWLAAATEEEIAAILRENGVENDAIVAKEMSARAKAYAALQTKELTNITDEEIQKLIEETGSSNAVIEALRDVIEEKLRFNQVTLETADDIANLERLMIAAGASAESIANVGFAGKYAKMAENARNAAEEATSEAERSLKLSEAEMWEQKAIEEAQKPIEYDYDTDTTKPDYSGALSDSKGSKTNKALDDYLKKSEAALKHHKDELKYIDELQYAYDNLAKTEEERAEILEKMAKAREDYVKRESEAIDKIQSAYSAVQDAMKEQSEYGAISVDTLQSLLELEPQYINMLIDESGNLALNEQAVQNCTAAYIDNLAAKAALNLIDSVQHLKTEQEQLALLTGEAKQTGDALWDLVNAQLAVVTASSSPEVAAALTRQVEAIRKMGESAKSGLAMGGLNNFESAKAAKDAAKAQEDYAEKQRKFAEDMAEAWEEEHLAQLEDGLAKQEDIIDRYKRNLEITDFGLDLIDEDDFMGRSDLLTSKLEDLTNYGNSMRAEFERIASIIPQTGEEAQALADRLTDLGSEMRDNISNIRETKVAIEKLRINAFTSMAESGIAHLESELDAIDRRLEILYADDKDDFKYTNKLLNMTSLLPSSTGFSEEKRQKQEDNREIIELERDKQDTINAVVARALEMQARDNAEARAKERAELIKSMEDARRDLQDGMSKIQSDISQNIATTEGKLDQAETYYKGFLGDNEAATTLTVGKIEDTIGGANLVLPEPDISNVENALTKVSAMVDEAQSKITGMASSAQGLQSMALSGGYTGNLPASGEARGVTLPSLGNRPAILPVSVTRWTDIATQALKITGDYSQANLDLLLYQMYTESNGNPSAINNWDSNAKNGNNSRGLMQVIPTTFQAYALPGYDKDIYDPLSNLIASIRYTKSRYGSLTAGWKGTGYATGTSFHPGGLAMVGDENWLKGSTKPAPELALYPNGSSEVVGEDGVEIRDLPRGTKVIPADQTKDILDGIPNYASGTVDNTSSYLHGLHIAALDYELVLPRLKDYLQWIDEDRENRSEFITISMPGGNTLTLDDRGQIDRVIQLLENLDQTALDSLDEVSGIEVPEDTEYMKLVEAANSGDPSMYSAPWIVHGLPGEWSAIAKQTQAEHEARVREALGDKYTWEHSEQLALYKPGSTSWNSYVSQVLGDIETPSVRYTPGDTDKNRLFYLGNDLGMLTENDMIAISDQYEHMRFDGQAFLDFLPTMLAPQNYLENKAFEGTEFEEWYKIYKYIRNNYQESLSMFDKLRLDWADDLVDTAAGLMGHVESAKADVINEKRRLASSPKLFDELIEDAKRGKTQLEVYEEVLASAEKKLAEGIQGIIDTLSVPPDIKDLIFDATYITTPNYMYPDQPDVMGLRDMPPISPVHPLLNGVYNDHQLSVAGANETWLRDGLLISEDGTRYNLNDPKVLGMLLAGSAKYNGDTVYGIDENGNTPVGYEGRYGVPEANQWLTKDGKIIIRGITDTIIYDKDLDLSDLADDPSLLDNITMVPNEDAYDLLPESLRDEIIAATPSVDDIVASYHNQEKPDISDATTTTTSGTTYIEEPKDPELEKIEAFANRFNRDINDIKMGSAKAQYAIDKSDYTDEQKSHMLLGLSKRVSDEAIREQVAMYDEAYKSYLDYIEAVESGDVKYNSEVFEAYEDFFQEIQNTVYELEKEMAERKDRYIQTLVEDFEFAIEKISAMHGNLSKFYEVSNVISDEQHNINKELKASMTMYEYLDEKSRALLFNQEDYNTLTKELVRHQREIDNIQDNYNEAILSATADEMDEITNYYERQYDLVMKKYEITKADLEIEKKRQQLDNVLNERNVQMLINGEWQWVANTQDVINAQNELADAEYAKEQAKRGLSQTNSLNQLLGSQDELGTIVNKIQSGAIDVFTTSAKDLANLIGKVSHEEIPEFKGVIQTVTDTLVGFANTIGLIMPEKGKIESNIDAYQAILDDPNSSEDDRAKAQAYINEYAPLVGSKLADSKLEEQLEASLNTISNPDATEEEIAKAQAYIDAYNMIVGTRLDKAKIAEKLKENQAILDNTESTADEIAKAQAYIDAYNLMTEAGLNDVTGEWHHLQLARDPEYGSFEFINAGKKDDASWTRINGELAGYRMGDQYIPLNSQEYAKYLTGDKNTNMVVGQNVMNEIVEYLRAGYDPAKIRDYTYALMSFTAPPVSQLNKGGNNDESIGQQFVINGNIELHDVQDKDELVTELTRTITYQALQ